MGFFKKKQKEYFNDELEKIKYVKVTFRDWQRNREIYENVYKVGEPKRISSNLTNFPIYSYVYFMDYRTIAMNKRFEKTNVVFLDENHNILSDFNYSFEEHDDEYAWLIVYGK